MLSKNDTSEIFDQHRHQKGGQEEAKSDQTSMQQTMQKLDQFYVVWDRVFGRPGGVRWALGGNERELTYAHSLKYATVQQFTMQLMPQHWV